MVRPPPGNAGPRRTAPVARLRRHNTQGPRTGVFVLEASRKTAPAAGSTTWSAIASTVLSRSTARVGHRSDSLRCTARAGGHGLTRADAARLAGRWVAPLGALPEHPAPVTISTATVAATARSPFTWIAPPANRVGPAQM